MNYGESRKPQGICEGAAWLSSARAVRCRLKCHNERNPCCQLLTGSAEDSDKTAIVRCEEGGDDVKSARPFTSGATHVLQWGVQRAATTRVDANPQNLSQFGLESATRLHEAGFASNRASATAR